MDEAWWNPLPARGGIAGSTLGSARQRPGAIFVDANGERFVNEANSYMEVGKAMYARNKTSRAVPCWLVFDDGYRRRYAHTRSIIPGKLPAELIDSGSVKKADSLADLARECGIDPTGLLTTVERFNRFSAQGLDPDYGRGESAYNRVLGDPRHKPNPALGPLDRAPYYALEIFPADIGTCGGLLTDEHARVLDEENEPIPGLYATGNTTATVMGRHYLGAGASIGHSMVFGHIAAQHATAGPRAVDRTPAEAEPTPR
jgi:3-oxosteroid 1-dehydrogenase